MSNPASRLVLLLIVFVLFAPSAALAGGPSPKMFVFGDSLSDPGNAFELQGTSATAPFAPIPSSSYAIGGHHFGNGPTWAELFAKSAGAPLGGKPALRVPGRFGNYAVGGSRARAGFGPSLGLQVTGFLADHGSAPAEATYFVFVGGNDIRDALQSLATDPTGAAGGAIVADAVDAVVDNVIALYAAGARRFVLLNAPNVGRTPAVLALGTTNPALPVAAAQFSQAYNGGLDAAAAGLALSLPGASFTVIDVYAALESVVTDPAAFGFEDATGTCLRFGVVGGAVCSRPQRFVFWDAIHPTRGVHAVLAGIVGDAVSLE